MAKNETKQIMARISEEQHHELRLKLLKEGKSIQEFVVQAVEAYLQQK